MGFLPEWWSQGVQGQDNNGGFGTAAMFNQPSTQQQGNLFGASDKIAGLVDALKNWKSGDSTSMSNDQMQQASMQPNSNMQPQMTPYQDQTPIGPNMNKVNNPYAMSPNGQIMPNWNRTYGGY